LLLEHQSVALLVLVVVDWSVLHFDLPVILSNQNRARWWVILHIHIH
jgi:hypothetical protein